MLTKSAHEFIALGERIAQARFVFHLMAEADHGSPQQQLLPEERAQLGHAFQDIYRLCEDLDLPTSKELFRKATSDLPETLREFEIYLSAVSSEMQSKTFVFLPEHRRKFFIPMKFISTGIEEAFPLARQELVEAGKSFAFDRYTACVFHCMRAVEIGLRTMATALEVKFDHPLELADQEKVIRAIEAKIQGMKDRKKSFEKDDDLNFYSETAMQFRYFKDGWRVRAAHTRATYDEGQALTVIEHSTAFISDLSKRLKEPSIFD
ncbi:hypothetical protein QRQ56_05305 [Bradyrhizobium sp. U531]|uniref:hypothetical protein n=1 Tax=Bradyrhizobium sp. U531 TaxID=3053458 RepID=UPI003F441628